MLTAQTKAGKRVAGSKLATMVQPPDDSVPSPERQAQLRGRYEANLAVGNAPYAGVDIRTRGELHWILQERQWRDSLSEEASRKEPANLAEVECFEANLAGVVLPAATLRGANFTACDFSGANFLGADLTGAFLRFADLSGAFLGDATLSGAALERANLSQARLWRTHLKGAMVDGANLAGAELDYADLSGASLRVARMDAMTSLKSVTFDPMTRVADVVWNGAPLSQVAWAQLRELGDERWLRLPWSAEKAGENREAMIEQVAAALRANQQLAAALRAQGLSVLADRFAYRTQVLQRKLLRLEGHRRRWLFWCVLDALAGYGYRPEFTLGWYLLILIVSTVIYCW